MFRPWSNIAPSLNAGAAPVAEAETLTPEQIRLETLALGFRTREGVSLATIRERPGGDAMVAGLTQAGLVRVDRDRVIATAQAWWWPTACPWSLRIETGQAKAYTDYHLVGQFLNEEKCRCPQ